MTTVDWVILALVLLLALRGYGRGFLVGIASLGGFVVGALVGSRVAPLLLHHGAHSTYAPLVALGGALLGGLLLGSLLEGVARRARRLLWFPPLRITDGLAGAALTACCGLGIAWIAGAALLQSANAFQLPAGLRSDLQHSRILGALDRALPPSGTILHALAHVDPLPFLEGRVAGVAPPDLAIAHAPGVARAAASVVRVTGVACGFGVEGSGWVPSPGLVVTNAHVVAGERHTSVQPDGRGPGLAAEVVVFNPHDDIAVLRVASLDAPALPLASGPAAGVPGAILGYPLDGPFNVEPARLGETRLTDTGDAYGNPAVREVSSLRGLVRPGNSGGPVVGRGGRVLGTVFAQITNAPRSRPGGLAVPNTVVRAQIARAATARGPVPTGHCAT